MRSISFLEKGNCCFKEGGYELAIYYYEEFLKAYPAMEGVVSFNLNLAKKRLSRGFESFDKAVYPIGSYLVNWNHTNLDFFEKNEFCDSESKYLKNFGAAFLGPIFAIFFKKLTDYLNANEVEEIFFLSREGFFLEFAFDRLVNNFLKNKVRTKYLLCSRSFLFKLSLLDSNNWDATLDHHYFNTLENFFHDRYSFSDHEVDLIKEKSNVFHRLSKDVGLGGNKGLITSILYDSKEVLHEIIYPKFVAYSDYLRAIGFLSGDKKDLLDLGFSGTTQKFLRSVFKVDLTGHYFITNKKAVNFPGLDFFGHLLDQVVPGTNSLIDKSLYMESILTAPHGQVVDIKKKDQKIIFIFGGKSEAQREIDKLCAVIYGAVEYAFKRIASGDLMSKDDVVSYYDRFVVDQRNFPKKIHGLLDLDDRISGFGFINPMSILK